MGVEPPKQAAVSAQPDSGAASRAAAYMTTTVTTTTVNSVKHTTDELPKDNVQIAPPTSTSVGYNKDSVEDVDVRLSFDPTPRKDDKEFNNLLTGLQGASQKDNVDEFDFDGPVNISAVTEVKEDRLEDGFTIQTTHRETVSGF